MLLLGADGESVQVIDSAADLYPEQQNVDNEIESKRQAIYEQYRPVMNVDTGNITQLSNVAGTDSIAYVVKGKVVYDEDGNIDYDKSDDTIYYKVYDKDGNEVDGGTPKPIYPKTRRTEFGKVLSDVPIEEYVDNELYPQEQNNIQQAINNDPTNIEQSTPAESASTDEYQDITEKKNSTEFDGNGLPFVKTSNGVTDFGYIPEDTGLTPAPIRLSIGDERTGVQHIVDRHGEQIVKAGFDNVVDFVEYVASNYDTITEGVDTSGEPNGTYLLQAKDKHNNTLYVELSNDGSYWNVNSGGVFRKGYGEKNKVVWSASEVQRRLKSATPDTLRSQDEADNQGDPNRTVSDTTSADKGTTNKPDRQEEFYNSLPRNKKGEIDESQMSAEQKIMYAQIEFGQRADLVRDYVAEQSKALSEKIAKLTNKTGKSVAEYKELAAMQEDKNVFVEYLNEQRQQQEQATPRRMVEEAAAEREERRAAEKEQREQAIREKEEREGVPDFMQDTPEDARLRGFRLRTGERIDRQEPIEVSKYNTARRKFTNDTGAVEGGRPTVKRTIIDNAQTKLQPSHRGGRSNIYHFITEAQPKERTDKASRVSAAQIAANINPEEITGGITAYNGSPIANNRLEVIQGNNRAEALRLMYEEYPKSAEAYKQYLIDNAENYGMSADEVRSMKEPIAVDIYEGADGNAILLGQYTQQDVESGGVHRINSSGVVKHLKSHNMLDRFITTLLNGVGEDNTVSDVISSNLRGVLPILDNARAISLTQRQGFFDEKGDVTSGAIDDFKNILTSLITEGGYANINSDFLNLPESAKTALYLQTYRAILNQEYGQQILGEIQDSILLYTLVFGKNNKGKVGADEARREVMSWLMTAQPDFNTLNEDGTYPLVDMRERFSNFAAELAILYKSTNLRSSAAKGRGLYNIWEDFYNLLEGKGDLFTTGEKKSLRESINKNFNIDYVPIRQNEHNTLGSRGEASRAGRRGSESELGVGEQSEKGTETADDRGRAEADIAEVGESRDVRYKTTDDINDRFNEELQQQIDGTLPKGHVYSLGMPNDILRSAGFPNVPIELSASHLEKKSIAAQHPFELKEIKSLVKALQDPMAVFAYGDKKKSQNVIVEIQHEGKNFVVGIHFNWKRGSAEISSIRGLYPKDNAEWLNWISQGKLLYVNKEKIQILIDQQRRNLADVEYLDLNYVAKVIKDFDNPTLSEEKNEETRLKASKRKARGATTEKLEELVTLLKKTGFADVKTGEDFYNALAEIGGSEHYLRPNGTVLGFVKGNTIYLNPDEVSLNTPIHEFGHLWVSQVKGHFPELWAKGKELFLESDYLRKVQADPNYQHLDLDGQIDEAMARAIGDRGEQELDKTLLEKILDWIAEVWEKIGGVFGIDDLTSEQISNLTLQDFTDMATSELLSGQNLTERGREKPYTVRDVEGEHRVINLNGYEPLKKWLRNTNITQKDVDDFNRWLQQHKNEYVRLYHGTSERNNISDEGIKKTSSKNRKSYQSQSGYVYLSRYPNMARSFGEINNMSDTQVYAVDIKIKDLLPDLDQINNQRAIGKEINNTLAESLIYGGGARVKRHIMPYEVSSTRYNTAEETADIKAKAISDGTFMKAPNGKDTNLNERQWLQVRTKAFKKWFGDWEKTARIEKLKKTKPIEITGEEYKGKYELNRDSAKSYIKDSLRGEYTNKDTGDTILLAKDGAQKVTSHSMGNEAHLKSIAVIPELIEKSIFIDELPNEKNNGKYDSYRYYVSGLKIGDVDYTVKLAIGIDEYGNKYYDHSLTEIEKGKLIDEVGALSTTLPSDNQSALSEYKDSKLISLLQTNSSKVVDENGEPMVVYHGTTNGLLVLVPQLIEKREDGSSWINNGKMREIADDYIQKHKKLPFTLFKQQDKAHKGTIEEFPNFWFTSDRKVAQTYAYTVRRTTGFKNNSEDKEIDEEGNLVEWVSKRKPPIAFYEVLKEGQRFDELNEDQLAEIKSIADKKGWILPYFPNRFWAYKILVPKDKLIDLRNREYEGYEFDYEGIKNRKEPYEDIYGEEFGYTGSFFLNIRTGEEVDFKGKKWSDTVRGKELNAYIRTSFKKNRDGLIAQNIKDSGSAGAENPANDYVVFSPTQIKSATDNIGTFDREDEDIRYSVGGADYFVNERFNEQLEKLTEENADSTIFYLGEPSAEMLAVGIKDSPLKLYGNKLQSKAKKHGFDVKDIKDLPEAIHDPIAIFEGAEDGSFAILTELSVGDNNVLATLSVGKGNDVDFNIVSSVYGKYNKNVVGWINKGKTLYVNKEKALDYLRISAPIAEAQDKGELVSATKIIENFENPPINEKKVIDDTTNDMVRYSIKASEQLDKEDEIMGDKAAEIYEARVKMGKQMNQSDPKKMPNKKIFDEINRKTENIRAKTAEHAADCYLPMKHFIETLNKHGYNIADYNNWYMNVFALAGKNEAEYEKYQAERSKPLQRAAKAAMDSGKISYRELENYLILKHGQERNEYFTERDKSLGIEPLKDVDREDTRLY